MRFSAHSLALILCLSAQIGVAQNAPLSAIDWLDEKNAPADASESIYPDPIVEPEIQVVPLEDISRNSVGLLPARVTGLPSHLWRESQSNALETLLNEFPAEHNPVIHSFLFNLLLTEADAPVEDQRTHAFLKARIRKLIDLGAVDAAHAMLERAAPLPPSLVPLLFELSLYDASIEPSCDPVLALGPNYPDAAARIYCLARRGDWLTATLVLDATEALGEFTGRTAALLHIYLETETEDEIDANLPPNLRVSALDYRLYDAIGLPLTPDLLPRAFAVSDLSGDNGWRAQLIAAERLAQTGAIGDNRFLGIYSANTPSASGGIWDRVAAFQAFETALQTDVDVTAALDQAWSKFYATDLARTFANIFAEDVANAALTTPAAMDVILMSNRYDAAPETNDFRTFVAHGIMPVTPPLPPMERAIYDAFLEPRIPFVVEQMIAQGRLGEAILATLIQLDKGSAGDVRDLHESLSTLRLIGLEDLARRAAIYAISKAP